MLPSFHLPGKPKRAPKVIKRGDVWDLLTNNGMLRRHVRSVACGVVYYVNPEGYLMQCSIATFRAWAKAAWLASADDWGGRDSYGRNHK
jgi:hypothetical protein